MGNNKLKRDIPCINIGTLGHVAHGKTTLISAISMAFPYLICNDIPPRYREDPDEWEKTNHRIDYETQHRCYSQAECPQNNYVREIIFGNLPMDAAILVVSAVDSVMSQTREQLLLAKRVGVSYVVVFLNKEDLVDDFELLELVKLEVRQLLHEYEFDDENTPIIVGSALQAKAALINQQNMQRGKNRWVDKIYQLIEQVDSYIPNPESDVDKPLLMAVQDVSKIKNRGTVAAGKIERGKIKVGDTVELVGFKNTTIKVNGLRAFNQERDEAIAGDYLGVLLQGIDKGDIERGMVIAQPGSITPKTQFESEVYIFTEKESGRKSPFHLDYYYQFYLQGTLVMGQITALTLKDGSKTEVVIPGDRITMIVKLCSPIAIEPRIRFRICEGSRILGAGVIFKILI
ncbi:MAG: GTP-binding protein [Aulosira sp. DedQUE10]|nr:GTP-binding protein [Aulosira sp. DedQUE10]